MHPNTMWYKNLGGTFVRFVTIHAVTDRQTDGQTDTIAIGKTGCILQRGKNTNIIFLLDVHILI